MESGFHLYGIGNFGKNLSRFPGNLDGMCRYRMIDIVIFCYNSGFRSNQSVAYWRGMFQDVLSYLEKGSLGSAIVIKPDLNISIFLHLV